MTSGDGPSCFLDSVLSRNSGLSSSNSPATLLAVWLLNFVLFVHFVVTKSLGSHPITLNEVPEWTSIKLEDVECREQLGGVIKSMHRKAA